MELPSKSLEQIAFNTIPKIVEHMLLVMDKSTHEEHLSQPLQTNSKQFKIVVTLPTGYNGFFNVTDKKNRFHSTVSISDDDFSVISIPPVAYELEILNDEIKRIFYRKTVFEKRKLSVCNQTNFSTLSSIIEIKPNIIGTQICFVHDDGIRDLLGFDSGALYEKYNLTLTKTPWYSIFW